MTNDEVLLEQVVVGGDLSRLSAAQRVTWYKSVCDSLGLNPLTQPFAYITLNGRLTLYATKACTDQLRRLQGVSIAALERELVDDTYVVAVTARTADGRADSDIGAVSVAGLRGDQLANAMMKAITKAKRRVTLSICGLGLLDETEVDTIPDARRVRVDAETGEIADAPVVAALPAPTPTAVVRPRSGPSVDPPAPAPPPAPSPRRKLTVAELRAVFTQRWQEAFAIGLPHIDEEAAKAAGVDRILPLELSDDEAAIVARGTALRAAIDEFRATKEVAF